MIDKYKPIILQESHYIKVLNDLNDALIEDGIIISSAFYFLREGRENLIVKTGSLEGSYLRLNVLKESGDHLGYWDIYKNEDFSDSDKGFFQVLVDLLAEAVFFEEWEFNYSFTQNRGCSYFPCHEIADSREFSCLFCYCPLYFIFNCGGKFKILNNGIKDCSDCILPHKRDNYKYIVDKLKVNI